MQIAVDGVEHGWWLGERVAGAGRVVVVVQDLCFLKVWMEWLKGGTRDHWAVESKWQFEGCELV